jgi:hypothetical protein
LRRWAGSEYVVPVVDGPQVSDYGADGNDPLRGARVTGAAVIRAARHTTPATDKSTEPSGDSWHTEKNLPWHTPHTAALQDCRSVLR